MIEEFRNSFRNRHQALRQEAGQGKKVAGWVCSLNLPFGRFSC